MPKQREPLAADDETVCSFCGMSHLMYTETKKLEKARATRSCCSLLVLPILLYFLHSHTLSPRSLRRVRFVSCALSGSLDFR